MDKLSKIREAGVVGAGGAGFPSHIKLNAKVDTVIANGAECEPLLWKDKELMRLYPEKIISGIRHAMEITGASKGWIALKKDKNREAIEKFKALLKGDTSIEIYPLGDYYPSGDEVVLVHEVTGRIVPPGGLPLHAGVVVSNIETFLNISEAIDSGKPVTDKYLTINGEVGAPVTLKVPIGTSLDALVAAAGGLKIPRAYFLDGGIMMAKLLTDPSAYVKKTTSGFIAIPPDHYLAKKKGSTDRAVLAAGKSACDQCSYCTELCPRYLLGHDCQPHRVMRSLGLGEKPSEIESSFALLCVECGLCGLYSCPENLSPNIICGISKRNLAKKGIRPKAPQGNALKAHPMQPYRKAPIEKLLDKLSIKKYSAHADFSTAAISPDRAVLPLSQHIGAPSLPVVKKGEAVEKGKLIAVIPEGKMGSCLHASISGKIISADNDKIIIEKQ